MLSCVEVTTREELGVKCGHVSPVPINRMCHRCAYTDSVKTLDEQYRAYVCAIRKSMLDR